VDEVAAAADLVMGKARGVPVALVRGVDAAMLGPGHVTEEVVRPYGEDMFR
jgi:coenzyme F420-0:L-glutamate ligase/coenzyme F420-1:gamma-L-glutamate ligase